MSGDPRVMPVLMMDLLDHLHLDLLDRLRLAVLLAVQVMFRVNIEKVMFRLYGWMEQCSIHEKIIH